MSHTVFGHFGELLQGRLGPTGPVALVTLPCRAFAATATCEPARHLHVHDAGAGVVTEARTGHLLRLLHLPEAGRFTLRLTMPPGGGAGASSAALMALALAAGARDASAITAAALAVEGATDPLLAPAPERLLWASRQGQVLALLPHLPKFDILGGFLGPGQRTDPKDGNFPDISDLVMDWPAACGSLPAMARLTSESARRTLALRGPADDPTEALAHRHGAIGFVIAHTGSARGLIFPPGGVSEAATLALREAGFSRITRFSAGGIAMFAGVMLVAMGIEAAIGWPDALYRRIGHPVTWIGSLITLADQQFNRDSDTDVTRRLRGIGVALGIAGLCYGAADVVVGLLPVGWMGTVLAGILAWPFMATRSLHDHVARVAEPLSDGDLQGARSAVAMIVGRDPQILDEAGVARAALESLAESTCDGVVAPLFWGLLLGLPGIAAFKAINTMDSMIGHLSPRYAAFGWAAARIDDVVNLIPARLSGVLIALMAGLRWRQALQVMWADAGHHRSPNAGWPEAALAGALNIRLSGPRIYDGALTSEPWVNAEAADPTPADLARGLALYRRAMVMLAVLLALLVAL